MALRQVGKPRGVLHPAPREGRSTHARYAPPEDLAPFVEHFWIVRWDFRGRQPFFQETLPHPSVHVVLEKGHSRVVGVVRGRFSRLLQGEGQVLGIKFRPGAFYPFVGWPISRITNRRLSVVEVFGRGSQALEATVLAHHDDALMSEAAAAFLRARLPERDEVAEGVGLVVERIVADREITKVEDLVSRLGWSPRKLQRLFSRYVGVGPKWVIQRYRLHEAVESIKDGLVVDWAQLALDLGYFDQAHFIRDFKALIGRTPAEYSRSVRSTGKDI
jgi:AraC-like DNA-binding protein